MGDLLISVNLLLYIPFMKKYFLGLTAIVCALVFSAFTKPFANYEFKLLTDPTSDNIVKNPAQWNTSGTFYGECVTVQNDIACKILLKTTRSSYFHEVSGEQLLNTFDYASVQSLKQDYLVIAETTGLGSDRVITSITAYRWDANANGPTGAYVTTSLGSDLSYSNAKD
jgi:hypothetical protein